MVKGELPSGTNIITDFEPGRDAIGINGLGTIDFSALAIAQVDDDSTASISGTTIAVLNGIEASALTDASLGL